MEIKVQCVRQQAERNCFDCYQKTLWQKIRLRLFLVHHTLCVRQIRISKSIATTSSHFKTKPWKQTTTSECSQKIVHFEASIVCATFPQKQKKVAPKQKTEQQNSDLRPNPDFYSGTTPTFFRRPRFDLVASLQEYFNKISNSSWRQVIFRYDGDAFWSFSVCNNCTIFILALLN